MNIEYKDFIGFFHNVYPEGYCQHLINEFDAMEAKGAGSNRQKGEGAFKHQKDDYQISLNATCHDLTKFNEKFSPAIFFDGLQACYEEYTSKYSVLLDSGNIRGTAMKMQRTGSGGGYHLWHSEQGSKDHANRVMAYMLYLNTLPENNNGETEFLYQQTRVNPKENLMLLWPAAYTHAHRGNPVYGEQSKYIVTGWFFYD
jgi:Rps23 Pro-64 3,4-dihydroxylase Tpa1-like proline 4-hydroxylase